MCLLGMLGGGGGGGGGGSHYEEWHITYQFVLT